MLCPVREVGRDVTGDGARDGELDDGKQDVKLSRINRRRFFFWPDMLVASKWWALVSGSEAESA